MAAPRHLGPLLAIVLVTLAAFVLRTFRLDFQSLWWDETYSVFMARQSLSAITTSLWFDQLPLYYYALWACVQLAGHSEFAVRSLSVAVGTLSIPALYRLVRLGCSRPIALLASSLLAAAAFHVYYSQETRFHALACLLCIVSAYTLLQATRRGGRVRWLAYGLAAAAALYTFYYSAVLLTGINVPVLFWRKARTRGWVISNAAAILALGPWLAMTYPRLKAFLPQRVEGSPVLDPLRYLERIAGSLFFGATHNETLDGLPAWASALGLALLALAIVAAVAALRRRTDWAQLMAGFALIPLLLTYLFMLRVPVFAARYVLGILPALLALAAAGWYALRAGWARWVLAAGVIPMAAAGLYNTYAGSGYARDDYRGLFATITRQSLPDEAIIYDVPFQFTALAQYYPSGPLPSFGLPLGLDAGPSDTLVLGVNQAPDRAATETNLATLAQQYGGFWAVDFGEGTPIVEDWLDQHLAVASNTWFGVSLRLEHYRRSALPAGAELPGGLRVNAAFGPLTLEQVAATVDDARVTARALWSATAAVSTDYSVSFQLFDGNGRRVAQWDGPPAVATPTSRWNADSSYETAAVLPLAAPLAPGAYQLRASVYDNREQLAGTQQTIATLAAGLPSAASAPAASGRQSASAARPPNTASAAIAGSGSQSASAASPPDPTPAVTKSFPASLNSMGVAAVRLDAAATDGSIVVGSAAGVRSGDGLIFLVQGSVERTPPRDYTWFAHAVDGQGNVVSQDDHPPVAPASAWRAGDGLAEVFTLRPVADATAVEIGLYDASGGRLTFKGADGKSVDHLTVPLPAR